MKSQQWTTIVFAIMCGIFVGSQINNSVRVIGIYHSTTSQLDAMGDMPLYLPPVVDDSTPAASERMSSSLVAAKEESQSIIEATDQYQQPSPPTRDGGTSQFEPATENAKIEPTLKVSTDAKKSHVHAETIVSRQSNEVHSQSPATELSSRNTAENPTTTTTGNQGRFPTPTNFTASGSVGNRNGKSIVSRTLSPLDIKLLLNPPPTEETMNACLFIMDDTIRLMEWLAYHYTVLPLGHLVVAIDPKSKRIDKINSILDMWREYITIDAYYNDTFLTLAPDEGWGRSVWGPNNRPRGWFKNKNGFTYRSQAHKRRQNFFSGYCFGELYEKKKRGWTILTDTDEFITFNYRYPETEDESKYDSETLYTSRDEIDMDRTIKLPIRDLLGNMTPRVTIAQYLVTYDKVYGGTPKEKCMRIPGLTFTSHESNASVIAADSPNGMDGNHLMTLRQRKHAAKDGSFSKAMLNLRTATGKEWFQFGSVLNVHTPNRRMCGKTTKKSFSGSGADYISSLFRIHHYKAGTIESFLERAGDWRGGGLWRFYFDRSSNTVGENNDLTHWFKWFVDKVGRKAADKLLLQPLNETYEEIGNLRHIKEAKEKIAKLVPNLLGTKNSSIYLPPKPSYYNRTNHTIGACMYIRDDTLRLMEWLAYHYTVLPLSHLILGIDPNSKRIHKIDVVIKTWAPFVTIEKYENESVANETAVARPHDTSGRMDTLQEHTRRQVQFVGKCLQAMKEAGRDLVFVTDSDEFAIFNYIHKDEDPSLYDTTPNNALTKEEIAASRTKNAPVRQRLPPLEEHVTIADFIHGEKKEKCYQLPSLKFSAHQDKMTRVELPPSAALLVSLLQHRTSRKEGVFSKAIVDVSQMEADFLHNSSVDDTSSHFCDFNGVSDSGTDYISSVLRVNHYRAGSAEQYAERNEDFVEADFVRFLTDRIFDPVGVNHDLDYWIDWFIKNVGMALAEKLLFKPFLRTHKEMAHNKNVKDLKLVLSTKGILPKKEKKAVEINDEGNAEEEEEGDSLT